MGDAGLPGQTFGKFPSPQGVLRGLDELSAAGANDYDHGDVCVG